MSQFDKRMEKIFDVSPSMELMESGEFLPAEIDEHSDTELNNLLAHDLKIDYENTRDNIDELIKKGSMAVDDMLSIARQTEKARDFEVAANMIRTLVDANKELLELQKKMRDITGVKKESGTTNIKNAVFVGSTAELMKAMKEIKSNDQ